MSNQDNKNVGNENVQHENELTFETRVIEKIANYAVKEVDGILKLKGNFTSSIRNFFSDDNKDDTKGVSAEVGKKEVALDLEVIAEYGKNIPKAFDEAIELISEQVEEMTNLKVVEVNMNVNDIMTAEEYEREKNAQERREREQRQEEIQERREQNRSGQYSDGSRVQ